MGENYFKLRYFWLLYFQHTWRIVFTARTRPAFRSPQSLRRPPDDVTALATLLVVMMTSPGGCTPAAPAALPREEGCRKANAFLCTPPPFQPGSSLHHHLRGHFSHPFHTCFITAGPLRAVTHTTPLNNPSAREGERERKRESKREFLELSRSHPGR